MLITKKHRLLKGVFPIKMFDTTIGNQYYLKDIILDYKYCKLQSNEFKVFSDFYIIVDNYNVILCSNVKDNEKQYESNRLVCIEYVLNLKNFVLEYDSRFKRRLTLKKRIKSLDNQIKNKVNLNIMC